MLYNSHFARKLLRAIRGFIAKLIIVENQFSPVSNPDRRDTLILFNVVCGTHQRQQASCCGGGYVGSWCSFIVSKVIRPLGHALFNHKCDQ